MTVKCKKCRENVHHTFIPGMGVVCDECGTIAFSRTNVAYEEEDDESRG